MIIVPLRAAAEPLAASLPSHTKRDRKAVASRNSLRPAGGDIDQRQGLDERASHRRTAVGDHIDLAEAGHRAVPVIECADRASRRIAE